MARILTKNINQSLITIKEIKYAINFYLETLQLSKAQLDRIQLVVRMYPWDKIENAAECYYLDKAFKPKNYLIKLSGKHKRNIQLRNLAHEIAHLRQFLIGEWHDLDGGEYISRFRDEIVDTRKTNYWDLPYEIDAYGREIGLYRRYLKHVKKLKRKKLWIM